MSQTRVFTLKSGVHIHAKLVGNPEKEALLCLSGFGCSHYNFLDLAAELKEDFFLVLIDNRGLGKSSPVENEYELEEVALDALEVMEQLGQEKFHLAGISMGGFLAQMIALEAEEKLLSLSLLCTTSGGSEFIPLPELTEESLKGFYALEEPRRTELAVLGTVHPDLPREIFNHICEVRREHPVVVEQVLKQKRAVDRFLKQPIKLESIGVKTLVLTGEEDRFVNPKNAERLAAQIPHSLLKTIPKCDHYFFMEKPQEVALEIKQFIQGVRS